MRSIWKLPLVTSLTQSVSNDANVATPQGGVKASAHVPSKPGRPLPGGHGKPNGRAAPDVKRVHSFANRRRNK